MVDESTESKSVSSLQTDSVKIISIPDLISIKQLMTPTCRSHHFRHVIVKT